MLPNWTEYAVTGCKLKWIPSNYVGSSGAGPESCFFQNLWTWQAPNINTIDTMEEAEIVALPSFKVHDPSKTFKLYFGCKTLSKELNLSWQECARYQQHGNNRLSAAYTGIRTFINVGPGLVDHVINLGWWKLDWYVTFRGPRDSNG